jgi:hypothetical protein
MRWGIRTLFAVTSFLAAALLFSAEPMIGKLVLPVFGGTPAVWNTCLLYFQVALLLGYLLAHGAASAARALAGRIPLVFLGLFAMLLAVAYWSQPIGLRFQSGRGFASNEPPVLALLKTLFGLSILPLLAVCATAPLVQWWFGMSGLARERDPYSLYAASNSGSLLALLAYPFLIEPNLGLAAQSQAWRWGFAVLGVLLLACGLAAGRLRLRTDAQGAVDSSELPGGSAERERIKSDPGHIAPATWLWWVVLVFIPSSWLMGVTTYLTTDLAAIPLLWTVPLALYLLSFIAVFAHTTSGLTRFAAVLLPYVVLPVILVLSAGFAHLVWIPLHLLAFFAGSVACHHVLARARPPLRDATAFYLAIAVGGLLGGVWNVLISPLLFDRIVEYPLAMTLACLVAPGLTPLQGKRSLNDWLRDLLLPAAVFVAVVVAMTDRAGLGNSMRSIFALMLASGLGSYACVNAGRRPLRFALMAQGVLTAAGLAPGVNGRLLHVERGFFGVLRVTHDDQRNVNRLFHGTTLHGQQSLDPALRDEPSTYFTRSGPIGQVFQALDQELSRQGVRIAIVGLGAGTLASYSRPGQRWTFYEINPAVLRIAQDARYFRYLEDRQSDSLDIVLGDARLRLREAPEHAYRLIVLDAFSSDALPVHLVSRAAIHLYLSKLADGGVLVFNLSNRYLDLDPVMATLAQDAGLAYRVRYDELLSNQEKQAGKQPSIWAVMAATEADLGSLATDPRWTRSIPRANATVWTDDYSNVASYLIVRPKGRSRGATSAGR